VAVVSISDSYSSYPTSGLTPEKLALVIREANAGYYTRLMEIYQEVLEKDTHIKSQLNTRYLAVTGKPWEIKEASDDPLDMEIAYAVREGIKYIDRFRTGIRDLLDAIAKGWASGEVMWEWVNTENSDGGAVERVYPWAIKARPQIKFTMDEQENFRLITKTNRVKGEPIPDRKFIFHRLPEQGSLLRAGVLRTLLWIFLFKNYTIKDWVSFVEVYGQPYRVGKYPVGAGEEYKDVLTQAVIGIATDAGAVIPQNMEIEFKEVNRTGSVQAYEKFAGFCNAEISKIILGQTLTSDVGRGGGGAFALGKVHADVRQDILEADCVDLEETLNSTLVVWITEFNFGKQVRYPEFKIFCEPEEDLKTLAETHKAVIVDMGLPVAKDFLYEKYNIPRPAEGEELLEIPTGGGDPLMARRRTTLPVASARSEDDRDDEIGDQRSLWESATREGIGAFKPILEAIEAESVDDLVREVPDAALSDLADLLFRTIITGKLLGEAHVYSEIEEEKLTENVRDFATVEPLAPKEAIEFFKSKIPVWSEAYEKLAEADRPLAFKVAGVTSATLIDKLHDSLSKALEEGQSFRTWKKGINEHYAKAGYTALDPHHIKNIFTTNVLSAYSVGRYKKLHDPEIEDLIPYFRYWSARQPTTRPNHQAMHGVLVSRHHSVWERWWPLNGYQCKCRVTGATERQKERWGVKEPPPFVEPDPGWAGSPGTLTQEQIFGVK